MKKNLYSNYIDANIIDSVIPYNCINQGDKFFSDVKKFEIYVDKTELLIYTNKFIDTEHKYICISRPRRFGKTISANMVTAYYDFNADVTKVFNEFKIAKHPAFKTFSNKFIVVKITVQDYLSKTCDVYSLIENIKKDIIDDLLKQFGTNYLCGDINSLTDIVSLNTHLKFVIVIDEWDCILREFRDRENWQKDYLDFLRYWLKDKNYIALVYMTGILPIKKYGTHSALNMFDEYSMVAADPFSEFVGFTETEVQNLCLRYHRDFLECKRWYDGYQSNEFSSIYNPRSVNKYISSGKFGTYWNSTETYESLRMYITLEKFPLHKTITKLLLNDSVPVNTNTFSNDMKTFYSQDDILTLLIHLGYLSYDAQSGSVRIPNKEIAGEFVNAIQNGGWPIVVKAIQNSDKLLEAVFNADCETVAKGIEAAHKETSILQYNDENALAYTISLAFYTARERYILVREFPTGKGFADLVFLARPNRLEPDLLIELKWDKTAAAAIEQIHERNHPESLANRSGRLILVGINYDTTSKKHSCSIEFFEL